MAVVKCTECGSQVSTQAQACPSCGAKRPAKDSWGGILLIVLVVVGVGYCSMSGGPTPTRPTQTDPATTARDEQRGAAVAAARSLKNAMHDPASFDLVESIFMADGAACITYRAKNGFGAMRTNYGLMTPSRAVHSAEQGNAFRALWKTHCEGKTGETITAISRNMM